MRLALSAFALALVTTGCAVNVEHDNDESGGIDEDEAAVATGASTFYRVRRDFRKCMYPMCGGVWYRQVNLAKTNCVGGGSADWCYAANSDFDGSKAPDLANLALSDQAIVRAKIEKQTINGGKWAKFVATEGWRALTATAITETLDNVDPRFYLLRDNGVRCFTTPCYSTDARRLNTTNKSTVSGVDLSGIAGATAEQLDAAMAALATDGLITFGGFKSVLGRTATATQAYVRIAPVANYCTDDSQCGYGTYHSKVTKASECYCPMCPRPVLLSTQDAYRGSWEKFCSGKTCPMVKCAAPPPVACVSNVCQFSPEL